MVSASEGFRTVRLTANKVLDERRHFVLLERLDGVADCLARKENIRRETFPVASVVHGATHRTDDNRQRDLSAEAGVLGALRVGSTVEEVAVKGRGRRDLGGELRRVSRLNSCTQGGVSNMNERKDLGNRKCLYTSGTIRIADTETYARFGQGVGQARAAGRDGGAQGREVLLEGERSAAVARSRLNVSVSPSGQS